MDKIRQHAKEEALKRLYDVEHQHLRRAEAKREEERIKHAEEQVAFNR